VLDIDGSGGAITSDEDRRFAGKQLANHRDGARPRYVVPRVISARAFEHGRHGVLNGYAWLREDHLNKDATSAVDDGGDVMRRRDPPWEANLDRHESEDLEHLDAGFDLARHVDDGLAVAPLSATFNAQHCDALFTRLVDEALQGRC
jgi:hypothetical protein